MNVKISLLDICVEVIIYLLLLNFHEFALLFQREKFIEKNIEKRQIEKSFAVDPLNTNNVTYRDSWTIWMFSEVNARKNSKQAVR